MATHCPRNSWQPTTLLGKVLLQRSPAKELRAAGSFERLIYESRVAAVYHEPLRSTDYVVDVSKIMCHEKSKVQDVCGFSSFGTQNRRSVE